MLMVLSVCGGPVFTLGQLAASLCVRIGIIRDISSTSRVACAAHMHYTLYKANATVSETLFSMIEQDIGPCEIYNMLVKPVLSTVSQPAFPAKLQLSTG